MLKPNENLVGQIFLLYSFTSKIRDWMQKIDLDFVKNMNRFSQNEKINYE